MRSVSSFHLFSGFPHDYLGQTIEVNVFSQFKLCFVSGMIVVDDAGNMAAGTTTNGANHKIPG